MQVVKVNPPERPPQRMVEIEEEIVKGRDRTVVHRLKRWGSVALYKYWTWYGMQTSCLPLLSHPLPSPSPIPTPPPPTPTHPPTTTRSILDCIFSRLRLPGWFRRRNFTYHSQVRLRIKLASGLGESWCRDGGIPRRVVL